MEKSKVSIQFLLVFMQSGDVLFFLYARRLRGYTATLPLFCEGTFPWLIFFSVFDALCSPSRMSFDWLCLRRKKSEKKRPFVLPQLSWPVTEREAVVQWKWSRTLRGHSLNQGLQNQQTSPLVECTAASSTWIRGQLRLRESLPSIVPVTMQMLGIPSS